jgi:hypothetical protein
MTRYFCPRITESAAEGDDNNDRQQVGLPRFHLQRRAR